MKTFHMVSGRVECPESVHLAGCLKRYFLDNGCEPVRSRDAADLVVLNGCERIAETPAVVRRLVDYAREHPDKLVLVVGCVPRSAASASGLDNFHLIPFWQLVKNPKRIGPQLGFSRPFELSREEDIFHGRFPVEEDLPGDPEPTEVAHIVIGTGCRGRCSFCTIRRGRGPYRSTPLDQIAAEAQSAVATGRRHFVLVADDAGCWGQDLGLELGDLLERLATASPTGRFYIRTMSPVRLPAIFDRLRPYLGRIDYLYLPLQSGSDRILELMQRDYCAGEILRLLDELKAANPAMVVKTDMIVGFPGETRADFRATVHAATQFHHAFFHRFLAYPDTPAASLPGRVDPNEVDLRIEVIRQLDFAIVDPSTFAYGDGSDANAPADSNYERVAGDRDMHQDRAVKRVWAVTANSECLNNVLLSASLEQFLNTDACVFVDAEEAADVLLLNVCNVLVETPDLIERYRELARDNPGRQVLILGCVPGGIEPSPEIKNFHVVSYGQLVRQPSLIGPKMGFSQPFTFAKADEVFSNKRRQLVVESQRLRHPPGEYCFITIGSGCQGQCTYCSIRAGRGRTRSVPAEQVVADARAGVDAGRFRLVLITDDAGSWGHDLGQELPDLLGALVEAYPGVRFEILDFNPRTLNGMFERLSAFMPRIDRIVMPLQSGNERILGRMQREYRAGDVLPLIRRMRQANPGLWLESDIIVGFPSETRAEFLESLEAAREFDMTAFLPYVPKPDTPAGHYPNQVEQDELRARMAIVAEQADSWNFKVIDPSHEAAQHAVVGQLTTDAGLPAATEGAGPRPDAAPLLKPPPQPCLAGQHALDLLTGCPAGCLYCDLRSGEGQLLPDGVRLLAAELDQRERALGMVYLSPGCEPLWPDEDSLAAHFAAMELLLDRGASLLLQTRMTVPPRFVDLFAQHPGKVKATLSFATIDPDKARVLEPRGSPVAERLKNLKTLVEAGIALEVGLEPLIPGLDDSKTALGELCSQLASSGASMGTVGFLQVTQPVLRRMTGAAFGEWTFDKMLERYYPQAHGVAGTGGVACADPSYRARTFTELEAQGQARGLRLTLCACNNLDTAFQRQWRAEFGGHHGFETARATTQGTDTVATRICAPPERAAPAAERGQIDALLSYVIAGSELERRRRPTPDRPRSESPESGSGNSKAIAEDVLEQPRRELRVEIGAGAEADGRLGDWQSLVENPGFNGAGGPPRLLPEHTARLKTLLGALGAAGIAGEAIVSCEELRVEVPDADQEQGTARILVRPWVEDERYYKRVDALTVHYRGAYTATARKLADRVAHILNHG